MRVLITGGNGFVARWLGDELQDAGHRPLLVPRDELDVTDAKSVEHAIRVAAPDAIAHLAAVSFGPRATADPQAAFEVNVGGTINLFETVVRLPAPPAVLVTGSSEVYGAPRPEDLPLTEGSRLEPNSVYGISKAAQEAVAIAAAIRHGTRVTVTRSFNHVGPGQRSDFVIPALAERVAAVSSGLERGIRIGNNDVRRDFTDVRDVVRAYRLLLERMFDGPAIAADVINVASGRSRSIGSILTALCDLAGIEPSFEIDPTLVRPNEVHEIRGDAGRLRTLTGWVPRVPFEVTLAEVWQEAVGHAKPPSNSWHRGEP